MNGAAYFALLKQLQEEEGLRLKPYVDCCGRGWRECVATPCEPAKAGKRGKLTIGYGRNLDDVGISEAEASGFLGTDALKVVAALDMRIPWWKTLDDVRQRVLADMAYNMGAPALVDGWPNTLSLFKAGTFVAASAAMRTSKWFGQVGKRAKRLAAMVESGREVAL